MFVGFSTTCCPDPRQVVAYLPEVRPTWFFAVPRIWEKLKAAIEAGIEAEEDAAEEAQATQWALGVAPQKVRAGAAGEPVPTSWRRSSPRRTSWSSRRFGAPGPRRRWSPCNVGAAPTPREVIEFFHALGIPLAELWGMSETTGYGTCNPPERIKIGTIGPPAPGVEVRLAEDGEILIQGPVGDERLPQPAREDRARPSRRTAGCTPATSASSTRTATCGSWIARRS